MDALSRLNLRKKRNAVVDVPPPDVSKARPDVASTSHPSPYKATSHLPSRYRSEVSDGYSDCDDVEVEDGVRYPALSLEDLPLELLELVLAKLKESIFSSRASKKGGKMHRMTKEDVRMLLAVCGVSRRWRDAAQRVIFKQPWDFVARGAFCYQHPNQLFATSPMPPFGSRSGLLKCFVRREQRESSATVITMYSGKYQHQSSRWGFMLSAVGKGRSSYQIFLERAKCALEKGVKPCARLDCNLLCTTYTLKVSEEMVRGLEGGVGVRDHTEAAPPGSLPEMEAAGAGDVGLGGLCIGDTGGGGKGRQSTSSPSIALKLQYKARMRGIMQPRRMEVYPSGGETLHNKAPHWNQGLNCWCLNFRGRVKLASVKNFQLVHPDAGQGMDDPIIMQFGKVEEDMFVLDFNPSLLSAVQAFGVALSTFNGRFV